MKFEDWNLILTVGGIDYTVSLIFVAVFLVSFAVFATLLFLAALIPYPTTALSSSLAVTTAPAMSTA